MEDLTNEILLAVEDTLGGLWSDTQINVAPLTKEMARWLLPWIAISPNPEYYVANPSKAIEAFFNDDVSTAQRAGNTLLTNVRRWVGHLKDSFAATSITPNLGDPHAGGLSTTWLRIENDECFIKPNRTDPSELISTIANRSGLDFAIDFPVAKSVGRHILQNNVAAQIAQDAASHESRVGFWANAGRATALLDVLGFNDGHYENVWATSSGRLCLIDDETLLVPRLLPDQAERSVLQTGLIQKPYERGLDRINSALMARSYTPIAMNYPRVLRNAEGTLELRFTRPRNAPTTPLTGAYGSMQEYLEPFIHGIHEGYAAIESLPAGELLNIVGYHAQGYKSRVVLNATLNYRAASVRIALNPDENDWHSISADLVNQKTESIDAVAVATSEKKQLLDGDVPVFSTEFASREIFDPFGVVGSVERTALDDMVEVLDALKVDYAERQESIIRNQVWRVSAEPL